MAIRALNLINKLNREMKIAKIVRIKDPKKRNEAIESLISSVEASKRSESRKLINREVEFYEFKRDKKQLLTKAWKVLNSFKRARINPRDLPPVSTNWYDTLSDCKSYDEFVRAIFNENLSEKVNSAISDMEKCIAQKSKKFITVRIKDAEKAGVVHQIRIPTSFNQLKADLKMMLAVEKSNMKKIFDKYKNEKKDDAFEQTELRNAIGMTAMVSQAEDALNAIGSKKDYAEILKRETIHDWIENNAITAIYLTYVYLTKERCEDRAEKHIAEYKKTHKKTATPTGAAHSVAELRRRFESRG